MSKRVFLILITFSLKCALGDLLLMTDDLFKKSAQATENVMVLKFSASWCDPCKQMAPIFEKVSKDKKYRGKASLFEVDFDESPGLVRKFSVEAIPHTVFLRKIGKEWKMVYVIVGAVTEERLRTALETSVSETTKDAGNTKRHSGDTGSH